MAKYSEPLMKKRFTGETLSEAKTKALKWVGKYVMCKEELHDIMYHFEEDHDTPNSVVVVLFVSVNENDLMEKYCTVCKEFHKSFFINENFNCNECRARAYQKRMRETLSPKKGFYRSTLKKIMEEIV